MKFKLNAVILFLFALTACSSDDNSSNDTTTPQPEEKVILVSKKEEVYDILMSPELTSSYTVNTKYNYGTNGELTSFQTEITSPNATKPLTDLYTIKYLDKTKISEVLKNNIVLYKYSYKEEAVESLQYYIAENGRKYYHKYDYTYNDKKQITSILNRYYNTDTDELASTTPLQYQYQYLTNTDLIIEAKEDGVGLYSKDSITYYNLNNTALNNIVLNTQLDRAYNLRPLLEVYKPKQYIQSIDSHYSKKEYNIDFDKNNYPVKETYTVYNKSREIIEQKIITTYTYQVVKI